ncbi:MAG: helicase C-terminal domain-containing protein [Candidatus Hadarchaeum sp.]|uniref:helicase C-terminal domain-containing protein n=1 Tax=Candidatus Hadarchaeum sp. TaxID=2883567 RepID=UPI003D12A3AF
MKKQYFPYPFREGQKEFIEFIRSNLGEGGVCLNAATGFGKTPAILAALLPEGCNIIWAVRTGNETDRPIEELKVINKNAGSNFFGLSYRGKRDMCLLARESELGELDYEDVSLLCRSQKGNCKYDFDDFDADEFLEAPLLYSEILELCRTRKLCPYKVQRLLLGYADVVSLSYNYIIDEGMGWSIRRAIPFEESYLVVDEAHNLQYACMNLNSDRITLGTAAGALKEMEQFSTPKTRALKEFLQALRKELEGVLQGMKADEEEFEIKPFLKALLRETRIKQGGLSDILISLQRYGMKIRKTQLKEGKRPHSFLHHLSNFWLAALENLGVDGIAFIKRRERGNLVLEMLDMRAAEVLRHRWGEFKGCIFCSGTLNPIPAFAETVGLEEYRGKSFPSPYSAQNVVSLITEGLSTRGDELSRPMAERYVEAIGEFIRELDTNLAVFSASYRIQNDLLASGLREVIENNGRRFFLEVQGISGDEGRRILDEFKDCARRDRKGVLCATATGRFAEGADFPGRELEGIFLVGIPFERMSVKTKLYLEYYERLYGKKKGSYLAYIVPALRRASQSLGRALRSKEDRAVLVCGDERYKDGRFFRLLPDFVRETAEVIEPKTMPERLRSWADSRPRAQALDSLAVIERAISENRTISIKYRSGGKLTERRVDPYEIRESKYLIGYCHLREDRRTFRIDRIVDVEMTQDVFGRQRA